MGFQSTNYDRYGNPLGTRSGAAATAYTAGIDRYLEGGSGHEDLVRQALEHDDGFALAHVALARFDQFSGRIREARTGAARARELAAGTSRREQQQVDVIATAIEGGVDPMPKLREHLQDFPTDAFVLAQASGVYSLVGFSGDINRNEVQLALLEPLAGAYGDDWWYLCQLAFAENERFQFEKARGHVERSLELHNGNGHGAHTMAHVHFETGEVADGESFLAGWLPGYDPKAQMAGHLSWHHALFALLQGDTAEADRIYREHLRPANATSAALGLIADAASLLWRRELGGEPQEEAWPEVRDFAETAFPKPGIMFADVHCALAYAAAGDEAGLGQLISGLRERAAAGKIPGGEVVPALAEAIAAFARGDYDGCIAILAPLQPQVVRVGGSHAQREVFEDTLLEAYFRAGRHAEAEGLLKERVERRITPRDEAWLERVRTAVG